MFTFFSSELQCSFYQKYKNCKNIRYSKNDENHLPERRANSLLPRRPEHDQILQSFKFEAKRDEMRKTRNAKFNEKYFRPKEQSTLRPDFCHDSSSARNQK